MPTRDDTTNQLIENDSNIEIVVNYFDNPWICLWETDSDTAKNYQNVFLLNMFIYIFVDWLKKQMSSVFLHRDVCKVVNIKIIDSAISSLFEKVD